MLDAFIIERIRQQRKKQDSSRVPLRVEIPAAPRQGPPPPEEPEGEREPDRGSVIIEDTI